MGVVIREGLKGTVVSYIGAGIGALVTLFVYPYFLSTEEVGLIRLMIDTASIFSFFALLGIPNVLVKFFPRFKEKGHEKAFVTFCFFVPIIGCALVCGVVLLSSGIIKEQFAGNSPLFSKYFFYTLPLALATVVLLFFESLSTIYQRIFASRFIRDILIRILTVALIFLYFYHVVNIAQFVAGLTLMYGVAALANYIFYNRTGIFQVVRPTLHLFDRLELWRITKFGSNTILAGLGGMLIGKIDVLMISSEVSLSGTGIYTIAFFIATMIEIPARSVNSLVGPQVSAALNSHNMAKVKEFYQKVTQNQLLISGTIFLLIWTNIDNLFAIMPNGDIYDAGKYVVLFIGLSKFFDLVTGINAIILGYSKYYFLSPLCTILLGILAIISNLILIPKLGITGAAIASLASLFIYNCIMLLLVKMLLKIQPFTWICLRIFAVLLVAFGLSLLIPKIENPYANLLVQSAAIGIFIIFVTVYFRLSEEVSEVFCMVYHKVIKALSKNKK